MYDRLKGFKDFYPDEMAARREVIDTLEGVARRYGFREIATPAMEDVGMYVDKSGEGIVEELYTFTDKGGRDVSLAPELTPTVARMVVAKGQELSKPIKWFSTRPFWRYEQVQQGRFREFYQTNVDIFGSAEPEADAEILAFAADSLADLGLPPRSSSSGSPTATSLANCFAPSNPRSTYRTPSEPSTKARRSTVRSIWPCSPTPASLSRTPKRSTTCWQPGTKTSTRFWKRPTGRT